MVRQPPALAGVSRSRARVCLSLRVTLAPVQGAAATTLAQQPDGSPAHPAAVRAMMDRYEQLRADGGDAPTPERVYSRMAHASLL